MSRHLLCAECSDGKIAGSRQIMARSDLGEPAEFERVVFGIAIPPLPHNRILRVNGEPFPLPPDQYECDDCSAVIKPGDKACARSIWTSEMNPVPPWEHEYLTQEEAHAAGN